MALRLVDPKERVDRITFNPKVEYVDHVIHVGAYSCPNCRTETEFNTGTLRAWERCHESPLGEEWDMACRTIRAIGVWEWFFDFACAGCANNVRVVYGHGGEWAMGSHMYDVLAVVETQDSTDDTEVD